MPVAPMGKLTIVYSNHRPETLPFAANLMRRHQAVVLEDPPDPNFDAMLSGAYSIDSYVSGLDTEYPEFSRRCCQILRELKGEGVRLFQVEPFLEQLLTIHEMFADGKSPRDIPKSTPLMTVYLAEKKATGALIDFYETAARGGFHRVMAALKRFARIDAARFRIRDRMRAQALSDLASNLDSVYIEAGTMHVWLRQEMRRRLLGRAISSHHLMASEVKALTGRSLLLGPGDALTLVYIFDPQAKGSRCDRLAARSLIYNKIVGKVELMDRHGTYPHLREEHRAKTMVCRLEIEDCEALFPVIRRTGTNEANARVMDYLKKQKK